MPVAYACVELPFEVKWDFGILPRLRFARLMTRLDQRNWVPVRRWLLADSARFLDNDSHVFGGRFLHPVGGSGWSVLPGFGLDEHHAFS